MMFILSGIAVSSILSAFYNVLVTLFPDAITGMVGFNVGSLSARTWSHLWLILPYATAGLAASILLAGKINLLAMGDEIAVGLGVKVEPIRLALIICAFGGKCSKRGWPDRFCRFVRPAYHTAAHWQRLSQAYSRLCDQRWKCIGDL